MGTEQSNPRLTLLTDALQQYRAEYALLADRWKSLETKAQGTATIAGVFVGGIFAITRDLDATAPVSEVWLLGVVILLLTVTILFAVRALYVRNLIDPPSGAQLEQFARDVARLGDEEISARTPDVYGEQFSVWREVNEHLRTAVVAKAGAVWKAQFALLAATLLMAMLCLILVVTKS